MTTGYGREGAQEHIYASFNPRYAQYAISILRTAYNFCFPFKTADGVATPAQRLGLVGRVFDLSDIVFFR